jgi:hypothetical protein
VMQSQSNYWWHGQSQLAPEKLERKIILASQQSASI